MTDHTPTRVKLVLDDVLMGRVEPTRQGVRAHVDDLYRTLPGFARTDLVGRVMAEIKTWKTEKEKRPMSPPKSVLRGSDTIAPAAEVLRDEPDLTAREVYRRLVGQGYRLGMAEDSFVNSDKCTRARELLDSGEAIDAPEPAEREVSTRREVPDSREVSEGREDPDPEPVEAEPGPTESVEDPEPEPVAVTRASNGLPVDTGDGDYVSFQLGGQRLDATWEGEEWDVAFEGTVGDGLVRELLGRMFGGSS